MQGLLGLVICLASVLATKLQATTTTTNNITISPECQSHCGDLMVPYPFGIVGDGTTNCSLNSSFDITCNTSDGPPTAFLEHGSIRVRDISVSPAQLRIKSVISWKCYNRSGYVDTKNTIWIRVNTPYTFSELNKFTVVGCNDHADILGVDSVKITALGCSSRCSNTTDVVRGNCSGVNGCCQTSIPKGLNYFTSEPYNLTFDSNYVRGFNPCSYAFLAEENTFTFQGLADFGYNAEFAEKTRANIPTIVDWAVGNTGCIDAQNSNAYLCKSNTTCIDSNRGSNVGYRCICKEGYEGNPYLHPGCQDMDECQDSKNNLCSIRCINRPGSYTCSSCPTGYSGDGWKNGTGCCPQGSVDDGRKNGTCHPNLQSPNHQIQNSQLYSGLAICVLCIVIGITWLYLIIKQRNILKTREKLFKQNGGEFLKEKLSANRNSLESVKIFTVEELGKATNNYAENTIVGQGGYGTVYKGILMDKRVVAIKKSKVLDKSQREQFINEMIILTQINHRNVVKLLGCCLEDEVPLLVYEFVSNNTLFHHIYSQPGGMPWLTWDNRLRIATESAGALAYLHSAASMPIIHRDFKSTNILLDENYTTKIADFGASRLVPLDHSQVTTLVQGTLGYLDPEYFHTSQLTDKSDVYSFGVVLVELLTSQKALDGNRAPEERSLATHFVVSMKQNRLFEILDPRVKSEGTLEQLQAVAELGKRCLSLYGEDRPTMKDVAMELEGLRKLNKHPWAESDQDRGREETRSLMIEKEELDLYTVRLDQYSNNFGEYSSDTALIILQPNSPR